MFFCLQGMFIVSFPYSVLEGGYWALVSMVVVAWVCCYTGKILIDCLYEDDVVVQPGFRDDGGDRVRRRVRGSYVDIAAAVWGATAGGRLVFLAQLIELLMTCILYVLLCGELMVGVFPSASLDLTSDVSLDSLRPSIACDMQTRYRALPTDNMSDKLSESSVFAGCSPRTYI